MAKHKNKRKGRKAKQAKASQLSVEGPSTTNAEQPDPLSQNAPEHSTTSSPHVQPSTTPIEIEESGSSSGDAVTMEPPLKDESVDQSEHPDLTGQASTTVQPDTPTAGDKKKKRKKRKKRSKGKEVASEETAKSESSHTIKDDEHISTTDVNDKEDPDYLQQIHLAITDITTGASEPVETDEAVQINSLPDVSDEERITMEEIMKHLDEIEDDGLRISVATVIHPYLYVDSSFRIQNTDRNHRPFSDLRPADSGGYLNFQTLKIEWMNKLRNDEKFKEYLKDPHWPAIAEATAACEVTYNSEAANYMHAVFLAQWDGIAAYDTAIRALITWLWEREPGTEGEAQKRIKDNLINDIGDRGSLDGFARATILTVAENTGLAGMSSPLYRRALVRGLWPGWWPPLREKHQVQLLSQLKKVFGISGCFIIDAILSKAYPPQDAEADIVAEGLAACHQAYLDRRETAEKLEMARVEEAAEEKARIALFKKLASRVFHEVYGEDDLAAPILPSLEEGDESSGSDGRVNAEA